LREFIYIYCQKINLHCNLYVKHKCCNALPKLKKYSVLSIVYKKTMNGLLKGHRNHRNCHKWYQSIDLPLMYQRFALDINVILPPSWNSCKTIQRKLIQIYSNCHVNFKCAANSFWRDLNSRYYTYSMYVNCLFSTCRCLKLHYYGVKIFKIYLWSSYKFRALL
jgi:hypothetical protein